MSFDRPLRGGCHCGRNLYIIQFPHNYTHNRATPTDQEAVQVLFNSHPSHLSTLCPGTPLPAYLRVPLTWYHTLTLPYHPDESRAQIRRVYDDDEARAKRHFCGFCGTPLSYWTEEPRGEGEYIQLALGSLWGEDLGGLEALGLLNGGSDGESISPSGSGRSSVSGSGRGSGRGSEGGSPSGLREEEDGEEAVMDAGKVGNNVASAEEVIMGRTGGLPWFDTLTEGSRLGTLRRAKGGSTNRSGTVRVEWEIVEWSEDETGGESPRKRKLDEVEGVVEDGRRAGVQP